ncbi:hypothetical protein [Prauserella muralis]|uniref:hypothetical protein n=1 Tax=Prauserella muralis TaxID=588067 RepID=UPI0011BEFD30|nr:hypothetical protein [Prauserella muralis]
MQSSPTHGWVVVVVGGVVAGGVVAGAVVVGGGDVVAGRDGEGGGMVGIPSAQIDGGFGPSQGPGCWAGEGATPSPAG